MSDSIPENVIFQSQPFDWQGRLYKACTAGFGFDLSTGRVLQNDVVMDVAMKALANGDVLDSGLPKKEPEWLLAGFAYAPSGSPLSRLLVDVECGGTSRRFLVEEKEPFERLSLTWSNTWGSGDENPNGLPKQQIERAPVTDADTPFGTPASPGPRGAWPCRMRKMGTYDTNWLRNRWPGIPDDFDWAFYNLSQPSQRLPGAILGDETFRITNMHPLERVIEGRLPGKRLRLFVERGGELLEHAITADTIWFFPNALAGLLLFHALVECGNESASDIGGIAIRLEPEEDPSTGASARDGEEANKAEGEREEEKKGEKPAPGTKVSAEPASLAMASSGSASKEVSGSAGAPSSPGSEEQAPPSPQPQQAPTDYAGEFSKALDENLSEINAGLAEAGLPPLSQEQIAATRAKLDQMAKELSSFEKNVQQAQEPELASVLREAGISETKIADMEKAMALPMPDPALCRTESEWTLLVDQYLERFSGLLRPSKGMLETMRTTFLMQGPWGAAAAENFFGEQMGPDAVLSKIGMKPEKAAEFVRLLDQDLPEDPKTMNAFLADLEEAGGFPKGRLAEKMAAYE
ncbi:MAG: DUF2169 domain-containing protein, partial [Desulfovibrio sp.]|nr:DUF2169 domain-containing protein [Desulfovibrio sp.]